MPLEKLQKQIAHDGHRDAEAILDDAKKQAEQIIKNAKERARELEEDENRKLEQEFLREEEEERESTELQEKAILLDARNKVIESAMPRLRSLMVKRIKKEGYGKMIGRAIEEASKITPEEELTLIISRKDSKFVKNFAGKVRYLDVGNGVVLQNKNGSVKISATIEGLFEESRPEIETMLIREALSKLHRSRKAIVKKSAAKKHRRRGR